MSACLICLGADPPDAAGGPYHLACLEQLFGVPTIPRIDLDRATFPSRIEKTTGRMSISGAQPKASMRLSDDGGALVPTEQGGTYILKPPHGGFVHLPENEHVTMCIARCAGLPVPQFGLFAMADGAMAYVIARFDRLGSIKRRQIDFCQLAEKDPDDKYEGTAEECAALALQHAGPAAAAQVFRLFLFSYWIGNSDLHLKNLALLDDAEGVLHMSPAYDLVCTQIYGHTTMCLPVGGKCEDLTRADWLSYAELHCAIPRIEAGAILDDMTGRRDAVLALLDRSPLPDPALKEHYRRLLSLRGDTL